MRNDKLNIPNPYDKRAEADDQAEYDVFDQTSIEDQVCEKCGNLKNRPDARCQKCTYKPVFEEKELVVIATLERSWGRVEAYNTKAY